MSDRVSANTNGFTLRVRATGAKYVQTIKRIAPSTVQRDEWEAEIAGPEPDLELVKVSPLAPLARKASIVRALRPAFEVDVERTSVMLASGGGLIEASIDQGSIAAHGETIAVRELELELKRGNIAALFDFARTFVAQAPIHPSLTSKAERGHLLAQGDWGRAVKSSKPRLEKGTTCLQAFKEICRTCLHDFDLNVSALETFDTVEAVHQGRIALRRLRASIALFKPIVLDEAYRRQRDELKWLAGLLGAVRDLDVLQANLALHVPGAGAGRKAEETLRDCEAKRLRAHQAVTEALASKRGRRALLDILEWIEAGQWQSQSAAGACDPIEIFARSQLKKRWKKLVKAGARLTKLGPAARHLIRIEAKRLRYLAEFFAGAPSFANDHERLKTLINHCERLQDALGTIRDEEAMAKFVRKEVRAGNRKGEGRASAAILSPEHRKRLKSRLAKELKIAAGSYSKLASMKPF